MDFAGLVVLVTGGTSGIGLATAIKFAQNGALRVIVCGRHLEKWERVRNRVPGNIEYRPCDVRIEEQVILLIRSIYADFGRLDVCFNNAGVYPIDHSGIEDLSFMSKKNSEGIEYTLSSVETYGYQACLTGQNTATSNECESALSTNALGVMYCLKWELIYSNGQPMSIVNTGSVSGMRADEAALYGATKAFVISLTKSCAKKYATQGIRINSISPGPVNTPLLSRTDPGPLIEHVPMRRLAQPEEIAEVVLFLASSRASYVTGANYTVDGGSTA